MGSGSAHRTVEELRGTNPFSFNGSAATSSAAGAARNSMKIFYSGSRPRTSFDQMELVANAQGNATSEWESVRFDGIMRKVEVSHAVSFKGQELDGENDKVDLV